MTKETPFIPSEGDNPTEFDGSNLPADDWAHSKDAASSPGPVMSQGDSPTNWADQQLQQFVDDNAEIPPDMLDEQKAVLLKPGDVVNDRFEVVQQLGFGGMGAVYHVKDRQLGTERALKVMLPSLLKSDAARERFHAEVIISQKLGHDNIVRIHDLMVDRARNTCFFTMELVEGKTLHRLLHERGGKLPVPEALHIAHQLCDALAYAHKTTIHRDLKPQNIMIQPDGTIKILDFGLAKLMSPGRLTKSSMALGTAYYQAPEQSVKLAKLDQRADIYSVGVILYQMLTGRIAIGRVKPPSLVDSAIPQALDDVILTCIEPEPEDRYVNAVRLLGKLKQAVRDATDAQERAQAARSRIEEHKGRGQQYEVALATARKRADELARQRKEEERRRDKEKVGLDAMRRKTDKLRRQVEEEERRSQQEEAALKAARKKADELRRQTLGEVHRGERYDDALKAARKIKEELRCQVEPSSAQESDDAYEMWRPVMVGAIIVTVILLFVWHALPLLGF